MTLDLTQVQSSLTELTNWIRTGASKRQQELTRLDSRHRVVYAASNQAEFDSTVAAIPSSSQVIYRLDTGEVYSRDGDDWLEDPNLSLADLGEDNFLMNPITGKVFFINRPGVIFVFGMS